MFACSGILFNHESLKRGREFVTRKIANGAARIKVGLDKELRLGNLEAKRDWGFAGDYVRAMWLMLQQDKPDDYVIGTGENHSVQEFVELAFKQVDLNWQDYVVQDEKFMRPEELHRLRGDSTKAYEGTTPYNGISFFLSGSWRRRNNHRMVAKRRWRITYVPRILIGKVEEYAWQMENLTLK